MKIKLPVKAEIHSLPVRSLRDSYKCQERYAYLLGIIFYKNKNAGHSQNTGVELSSDVLRDLFGGVYSYYIKELVAAEYIIPVNAPYSYTHTLPNGEKKILHCKGTYKLSTSHFSTNGTEQIFKGHSKRYKLNTRLFGIKPKTKDFEIQNPILVAKLDKVQAQYSKKVLENFAPARKQFECIKTLSIQPEVWEFLNIKYPTKTLFRTAKYLRKHLGTKERLIAFLRTLKNNRLTEKNVCGIMKAHGLDPMHSLYGHQVIESALRLYFKRKYRTLIAQKMEAIGRGEHDFLRFAYDTKTNRLFSLITETPKDLMPFVRMDHEALVEIDGNNTQWSTTIDYLNQVFRMGAFYKKAYLAVEEQIKQAKKDKQYDMVQEVTLDHLHDYIFTHHRINFKKELYDLHLAPEVTYKGQTHLNRYLKKLFLSGNLWYKRLYHELENLKFAMDTGAFRSDMLQMVKTSSPNYPGERIKKDLLAWVLFGPSPFPYYKDNTVVRAFGLKYRNILMAIEDLKNRGFNHNKFGYSSYERWKLLSIINQRKEASIFVLDATANISEPFLTKHDALYVKQSDADVVFKQLQLVLKKNTSRLHVSMKAIYDRHWRDAVQPEKQHVFGNDPNKVIEISARLNKHSRLLKTTG